jgi:calcineurin-like phosphoesterase family protein
MKTFITSDLHFGHRNIKKFCPITRSKYDNDTDRMNEQMIVEWNEIVEQEDTVYILGDVAFMSGSDAARIMNRLNGRKILVEGNHDRKTLLDVNFRNAFSEIHKYLEVVHNGTFIVMCHYPIYDHNGAGRGSIMLHGHRHGNPYDLPGRIKDVGMDSTGKIVVILDDVIRDLEKIPHMYHHDPRPV